MTEAATASPDPSTTPPGKRSWPKALGLVVLGVLVLVCGLMLHHQRRTTDRLRLAVEELDRKDPGWRLEEIEAARRDVPDEENGALIVEAMPRLLPKDWPSSTTEDIFRVPPAKRLSAADFARLEAELKALEPALEAARRLAWFPDGRFPLVYARNPIGTLLPHLQEVRRTTELLALDALRHAQAGHGMEAMHSCRAAFHSARTLGDEPFLTSQMVRITCVSMACEAAECTLAQGEPDPKELDELRRLLKQEENHPGLTLALRGDRALIHRGFEVLESGELSWSAMNREFNVKESFQDRYLPWIAVNDIRTKHPHFLSLISRQIEVASLPVHEQAAAARRLDGEAKSVELNSWLKHLLEQDPHKLFDINLRHHSRLRCLLMIVAAERYRRAHGHWPAALGELAPEFVGAVPLDPYDGEPLRYRRLPDGVVVYSVGPDGSDDGGNLDRDNPMGKGRDLGCRLWDVKQRRQPPRLPPAAPPGGGPR
jgi:hypothetical protein